MPTTLQALAEYHLYRFTDQRYMYERSYASLKATESAVLSINNMIPFKLITIDDGGTTRTFYSNEITRKLYEGITEVQWIQQ
jgi:hypothetical protein